MRGNSSLVAAHSLCFPTKIEAWSGARRAKLCAGYFAAMVLLFMVVPSADAATVVTGTESTTAALVIDPSQNPSGASTDSLDVGATATVAYVQTMPVTKVADEVTLGDLSSSCGGALRLWVRETNHATGSQSQVQYSPATVAIPSSSGRMTWQIPPTTLLAGRGYSFSVSGQGCAQQKSWAHPASVVNGGSTRCIGVSTPAAQSTVDNSPVRMWHELNQSDRQSGCSSSSVTFQASMPTGWLVTDGTHALAATNFSSAPTATAVCGATNVNSGAVLVRYRDSPGMPGYADYVCMWPQYGPLAGSVADGWHYGLPWRGSGATGAPREAYVKLRASRSGPSEPELRGLGGAAYHAAPNLRRPHCADPVNCITGNLTEAYADHAVGGRGVGLKFVRNYNSKAAGTTGAFGFGWSFSFGESLAVGSGGQVTVTHDDGSTAAFMPTSGGSYAAAGWVQSKLRRRDDGSYAYTLPDRRVLSFTSAGRLEWVEDRNENRTSLQYSSNQLIGVTDPAGRSMTIAHNTDGTISEVSDPAGHDVLYAYTAGELRSVTDAGGGTTAFVYDASHRMTSVTDARGKQTTNVYDSQGRVTKQTDPLGHDTTFNWATAGQTRITDPTGRVTIQRFENNLPTSVTKGSGTSEEATTSFEYDFDGNPVLTTDANSHHWASGFDERGNITSTTDPVNHTATTTYDADRNVTSTTTPSGRETEFDYDDNGNLTSIERTKTETSQTLTTTLAYDGNGQVTASTDPLGRETTYGYNARGDRLSTTTPEGHTTTATYDDASRVATLTTARGHETTTTRDAFGHPTDVEDPLGKHTLLDYDADQNLVGSTDRDGKETTYTYDDAGRQTQVTRPDASTLRTGYDHSARVTSQTDGLNHATTYTYDGQGRPRTITDPLSRTTTRGYDDAGNLTTVTDPLSRMTSLGHDIANRLTGVDYSTGNPGDVSITYTVDDDRATVADDTGTTTYEYDSLGRLSSHTSGADQTTAYNYDLAGQLSSLEYPDALTTLDTATQDPQQEVQTGTVDRDYDDDGNLVAVTDWLSHQTTFGYDADGNLTDVARPNGTTASYDHDANGALTDLTDRGEHTDLGRTDESLLSSSTPPVGSPKAFSYDDTQRLVAAGAASYEYDDADNLTQTTAPGGVAVEQAFDVANQLTGTSEAAVPTADFDYDALGNRTTRDAATGADSTYGYDQAAQLVSYAGPDHAAAGTIAESYGYDADGLRQTKTTDGILRNTAYDLSGELPLVITDGPTAYITGPGGLPIEQITQGGTVRYYHQDQLGSTTALTSQSGTTVATYDYDAYGNPVGTPPTIENPFGYAGQYTDAASGLQYLRARYYDPATGQFITRDPLETDTRQPYAYAANSPTNYTDPTGEDILGIGSFASNAAAGILDTASFGLSTKLAGKLVGFDADCAEFGRGFGYGQVGGLVVGSAPGAVLRIGERALVRGGTKGAEAGLSQSAKRRLAKQQGAVPRSATPAAQGGSTKTGRWWEYLDANGKRKIVVEHPDGSVHLGVPKPQSTHMTGGPPKFYDYGNFGHVGG